MVATILDKMIRLQSFQIEELKHYESLMNAIAYASRDSYSKQEKYRKLEK